MKTNSILRIFAVLIMMIGFAITGLGQTGDLTANATVVTAITVESYASLEFGNLSLVTTKTVDLIGGYSGGVPGGVIHEGVLKVTKTPHASVGLSFTSVPGFLTYGTAHLGITFPDALWNTSTGPAAGLPVPMSGTTTIDATNADPIIYIHVGGTVTPNSAPNATVAGVYTGTITLQAEYN
jgi:hypothetical protein